MYDNFISMCRENLILDIFNLNIFMFNYSTRNMIMIFVNKKIKIVGTL